MDRDLSELMQQGEFLKENNNPLDLENETNVHQPKVISLKALREAMHAKKLKEKKEAAKLPDVKIPGKERRQREREYIDDIESYIYILMRVVEGYPCRT